MLEVKNISKRYGQVQALDGVNLHVKPASVHCLLGENGSGKSTLTKIIAGVVKPDDGTVRVGDLAPTTQMTPRTAIVAGVAVIYQDFALFPNLTVAENIAPPPPTKSLLPTVRWQRSRASATEVLSSLGVDIEPTRIVETLPVAERQLVAIARAAMSRPRVMLMDEPTAALTQVEIDALLDLVHRLRDEQGMSFMFISHKLNEVMRVADEVSVLRNGAIVSNGPASDYDTDRITMEMTGRDLKPSGLSTGAPSSAEPMIKVVNLSVGPVRDVSFIASPGEIVGFAGLLGSGRTELALGLAGLLKTQGGEVQVDAKVVKPGSIRSAMEAGIAYVPEDRLTEGLFLNRPIRANVAASVASRHAGAFGVVKRAALAELANRWLRLLSVKSPNYQDDVSTLSGGNQQRVLLAKWFATEPKVLILNGPTVGVDVGSRDDIHREVKSLADSGIAVLVASDDLGELLALCHRVIVLRAGRAVGDIDPTGLDADALWRLVSQPSTEAIE